MDLPNVAFGTGWVGLVSLVVAFVLPLAVALVSKESWAGYVKFAVLLALAAVKVLAQTFLSDGSIGWDTVQAVVSNVVVAVVVYVAAIKGTPLHSTLLNAGVSDPKLPAGSLGGAVLPADFTMTEVPAAVVVAPADPPTV